MNEARHEFAPAGLIGDVLSNAARVAQGEIALLRAEARQRARSAYAAIVMGALAAVLGVTALNVLAAAAITAVEVLGVAPHWATLIVGVTLALIATVFGRLALIALRDATTGPARRVEKVMCDVENLDTMVKQHAR